jgi:branched-subunit amino acid transport protein
VTWGWPALAGLAAGSYVLKAVGLFAIGDRRLAPVVVRFLALLPAALFGALIVVSTFGGDRELVLDARAAGLAVAGVAVWRRASFVVVVVTAAATSAAVRAIS